MKTIFTAAAAVALVTALPALAQMAAADPGVAPMTGTPAKDYVAMAADSDMYETMSSRVALQKAQRADVKAFANQMVADHTRTTKNLMSALRGTEAQTLRPPHKLSDANEAKIAALKSAPKDGFDALYLQQQLEAHQTAWALHKGYSTDGDHPALRQVATSTVPIIEQHLSHVRMMAGSR